MKMLLTYLFLVLLPSGSPASAFTQGKAPAAAPSKATFTPGKVAVSGQCTLGSAIQNQLNAVSATGGLVFLPCGCWDLTQWLEMSNNVTLQGSGNCTILYVGTNVTGIVGSLTAPREGLKVLDLMLAGKTGPGYIGIDFRNVSVGRIRDVRIDNFQTGVLLYSIDKTTIAAYYNVIEDVVINATKSGIEVYSGANENIIRGGRIQGPTMKTGILVQDNDNVKIEGTAIESLCRSAGTCSRGIVVQEATATLIIGARVEGADIGVYLGRNSTQTVGLSVYCNNTDQNLKIDGASKTEWIGKSCK